MLRPFPPAGCGEGRGAWRRALGRSLLAHREGKAAAAHGCGLWAAAGQVRHMCRAHSPDTAGSPRPAWALGPAACPHQTLSNPPCLLCLHQVSELFPLEELCSSKEGFPGGLQNSRSWEMAPRPGEGELASPSPWLCSWGGPGLGKAGHALSQTCGGLLGTALRGRH